MQGLKAKFDEKKQCSDALARRRDGVVAAVAALSASPGPARRDKIGDDNAVLLDFPEVRVDANV